MDTRRSSWIPSFSRRHGKSLPPRQKALMRDYFPALEILRDDEETLCPETLFPEAQRIHLEIGFGAGEHMLGMAQRYSEDGFIGCEPFINGVSALVSEMDKLRQNAQEVQNIRLYTDDARRLMDRLPDGVINNAYILFPDPWPKTRHHKRRLVSADMLTRLARIQPKGAQLLLATDHEDYAAWMLEHVLAHEDYEWMAESQKDWQSAPEDWTHTRYEEKTRDQGRAPCFIHCVRV